MALSSRAVAAGQIAATRNRASTLPSDQIFKRVRYLHGAILRWLCRAVIRLTEVELHLRDTPLCRQPCCAGRRP
jgi:hypothetical protein